MKDEHLENPNCDETYAGFRISGDFLDPVEITNQLHISPSFSCMKGDEINSRGGKITRPTGIWSLESKEKVKSTSLELHLKQLVEQLEPVRANLVKYIEDSDTRVDIVCFWASATGHGGPILSRDILSRISCLCENISFDFYGPVDD
ncbi:conserved hypothetical protein [Desulfosarcina cetonica]|uniref:DUF4279 domain-containing protein n=1 Tax=Desulfosarcina cetonica TaxID=90730 RepID=UPI0009FB7F37|nr:DUF4279 domain-containing protein [Desulfosarcina cetonica]VTR66621.1 conserved hypothetical protein [Desulfosarcina cetonica]